MYVILHGNPVDGLGLVGPFPSADEATEYADEYFNGAGEWWIVELEAPATGTG